MPSALVFLERRVGAVWQRLRQHHAFPEKVYADSEMASSESEEADLENISIEIERQYLQSLSDLVFSSMLFHMINLVESLFLRDLPSPSFKVRWILPKHLGIIASMSMERSVSMVCASDHGPLTILVQQKRGSVLVLDVADII